MPRLNIRQQQILAFINEYHLDRSYMPSVRDIQAACGISSTSVVDYNLRILEREGFIRRSPDISRGLELVNEMTVGPTVPGVWARQNPHDRYPESIEVPILGSIAAGLPIPVPEAEGWGSEESETVTVPAQFGNDDSQSLFALRVKGYSMIDALITDGDIVVLKPTSRAHNGDMVAAWLPLEGEATLKRFFLEGSQVRLQPENIQMDPIVIPAENVQVHGRVVGVIRRMA